MIPNITWTVKGHSEDGALEALVTELVSTAGTEPGTLSHEWTLGAYERLHAYERYADATIPDMPAYPPGAPSPANA